MECAQLSRGWIGGWQLEGEILLVVEEEVVKIEEEPLEVEEVLRFEIEVEKVVKFEKEI